VRHALKKKCSGSLGAMLSPRGDPVDGALTTVPGIFETKTSCLRASPFTCGHCLLTQYPDLTPGGFASPSAYCDKREVGEKYNIQEENRKFKWPKNT
jgi:hypothetical protein